MRSKGVHADCCCWPLLPLPSATLPHSVAAVSPKLMAQNGVRPCREATCTALAESPPPAALARLLSPTCPLTVRKFSADTSAAVHALFTGCAGARLGLLGRSYPYRCGGGSSSNPVTAWAARFINL